MIGARVTPYKEVPFDESPQGFLFYDMNNREYEIKQLSEEFYLDYSQVKFPEILHKEDRPYIVFVIKINDNTFAVPFRTNITHNQSYRFKNTNKQTNSHTGLDFSKAVIVNEERYLGKKTFIDDAEYIELENKIKFIIQKFTVYVNNYIKYIKSNNTKMIEMKYKYSSIQYFNKELGI